MQRLRRFLPFRIGFPAWLLVLAGGTLCLVFLRDPRPIVWSVIDTFNAVKHSAIQRFSQIVEGAKVTTLLDVELTRFDLSATADSGSGYRYGAIEHLGAGRLLLATDYGQFFLIDTATASPAAEKLPLKVDSNRQALVEHAARNTIRVNQRWLRVDDLLLFDGGRRLAVSFSRWDAERHCVSLRVAVMPVPPDWRNNAASPEWREVFRSEPCLPLKSSRNALGSIQSGGRMIEAPDGRILLSVGDFEFDGQDGLPHHPQDLGVDYGKIIEVDPDTSRKRVVTSGHRNPQGLARDAEGRVWSSEHGPYGGDELNLIIEGANYGWPEVTLGVDYGPRPWPLAARQGRHPRFKVPSFSWLPSIGASQLLQVKDFADEWDGDLLLSGMEAKTLFRIRLEGDVVQYVEPIAIGSRVRDMVQDDQGSIWMWTDEGNLIRLRARPSRSGAALAALSTAAKAVVEGCIGCHDLSTSASAAGRIPLAGVAGRKIASMPGFGYTPALKRLGGVWTPERLDAFIASPNDFAPGTAMPSVPIANAALRSEIVEFLRGLK